MSRLLLTLAFTFFSCAGPSSEVPANENQARVVETALAIAARCEQLDDLSELGWSWAQLCWHPDAPDVEVAESALEGCRAASVERGLVAVGRLPSGIELGATLDEANCPAPPPTDESELQVYSDIVYPIDDGATIQVTFTNFCDEDIHYGFTPEDRESPPLRWELQPLTRRKITIPRGYRLQARPAFAESWAPTRCKPTRRGEHLSFDADCSGCTLGMTDPLRRADCLDAGSCSGGPS